MAQIERDDYEHLRYFFMGATHTAAQFLNPPGCQSYDGLLNMFTAAGKADLTGGFEDWSFADFVNNRVVVAGTPAEVGDQIEEIMREANVGHLMTVHQIGSMKKELVFQSIDAFAELLPPSPDVGGRVGEPLVAGTAARDSPGVRRRRRRISAMTPSAPSCLGGIA